ncbi:unnamed protein product [Arabidopsis lyrata]|nr:unnamed protein product [Arabidopsis lyrata]
MKNRNVRVAWNFCNEVGDEAPSMRSPRLADCADLSCPFLAVLLLMRSGQSFYRSFIWKSFLEFLDSLGLTIRCVCPGNAEHLEEPFDICDPYSNPQAQDRWSKFCLIENGRSVHGYPEKKGDGWTGDSRTWVLDVGVLLSRLYFY